MRKNWDPFLLTIIAYRVQDVVSTSSIFEEVDSNSSVNDDFEGEIDWG